MKKLDILKRIIEGASIIDPRIGLAARGVEAMIHRDNDPTNDVDETAAAITEIALNSIATVEDLSGHDIVNNPALAQLAANIKGDITLYIHLVQQLKPTARVPPGV